MCCLFVHAEGTTGMHAKERREHVYAGKCAQCGKELDASSHVAAHMEAYPCGNPCLGFMTLRTTCRGCNNYRKKENAFWGGRWKLRRLGWVRGKWTKEKRKEAEVPPYVDDVVSQNQDC